MSTHPVLLAGRWQSSEFAETFRASNPATGESLADVYPVSTWRDLDTALSAASDAASQLRRLSSDKFARFLHLYAEKIESSASELIEAAHLETALPKSPRLQTIELPRTTTQLRQAVAAALDGSWSLPTIDTKLNIRSYHAAIGPVLIMGPNNFPLAFNAISGGDFAAAIAAGNPIIAKAHPSHPTTTRLLADAAFQALADAGLPPTAVQLLYHFSPDTGLRTVADPRLAALAFTGSRRSGLALKAAADAAGKPAYLEMSSLNPVIILPAALRERPAKIADEFADSALAANGQFCTNPGLTLLLAGPETDAFIAAVKQRFESRAPSTLLSAAVCKSLHAGVQTLLEAGAVPVTPSHYAFTPAGTIHPNTLLRVAGKTFLENAEALQTEAFGNASLLVIADSPRQLEEILHHLEGNLTACLYSHTAGEDDALYNQFAPLLRPKAGRLLNDKMPTGVALSAAMNHGGPYPSTGHPGFTAVGIPASLRRFTMLQCFDGVRPNRLPPVLQNKNPGGGVAKPWRLIDGAWSQADIP